MATALITAGMGKNAENYAVIPRYGKNSHSNATVVGFKISGNTVGVNAVNATDNLTDTVVIIISIIKSLL